MNNESRKRRSESDGDSDGENLQTSSSTATDPRRRSDRKRRRGVVEKRRRDRINQSLGELRRLVPAAFEKQGSAKLEKAEILQMTVDHLKMLNAKGVSGYSAADPAGIAMDYRSVGFRECAAEVTRFLVTMEGMDIQDPLRMRLLSHLQCYSAQREAASKLPLHGSLPPTMSSAWGLPTPHVPLPTHYSTNSFVRYPGQVKGLSPGASCDVTPALSPASGSSSLRPSLPTSCQTGFHHLHSRQHGLSPPTTPLSPHLAFPATTTKPHRPWGSELAC